MRNLFSAVAVASGLLLSAPGALAQDASSEWKQTLFFYGMGVAIDGTTQMGPLELDVDVSMSDVFGSLHFGGMAAYRVENDVWSFTGDLTYMKLGQTESGDRGLVGGRLRTEQFTAMGTVGRRLTPRLEGLFSLAYFDVSADLTVRVLEQRRSASRDADWIDPMIGLQYVAPIADKWSLSLRGDVGGFGVGSDFSWHAWAGARRQNTESFSWYLGYRALASDYEEGSGPNLQHYDLLQHGPVAGIAISF
jgi:hypothetical protein